MMQRRFMGDSVTRRLSELKFAARLAFRDARHQEAEQVCREGLNLAERHERGQDIVYFRFWYAEALAMQRQRLRALGILTPNLRRMESQQGRPSDIFNTLTLYVNLAIEVPLGLAAIVEPLAYCEQYIESINQRGWRPKLLLLKAHLEARRGNFEQALTIAEEGWGIWQPVYPYYIADAHLEGLLDYCLHTRQPDRAHEYLAAWRHNPNNDRPLGRNFRMAYWETTLLRYEGRLDEALRRATQAVSYGVRANDSDMAHKALAQVHMCRGDVDAARAALCQIKLSFLRRRPILLLDYHLACVRAAAGMPPADDEFGLDFPPPSTSADPDATRRAIARTHGVYPVVVGHARRWDAAFECAWRQEAVADRMRRLEAIAAAL